MSNIFLVIGEECTDEFVYGKAERLSPEAPVPVFIPEQLFPTEEWLGTWYKTYLL